MDPIGGKVGMLLSFHAESGRSMPERTADAPLQIPLEPCIILLVDVTM